MPDKKQKKEAENLTAKVGASWFFFHLSLQTNGREYSEGERAPSTSLAAFILRYLRNGKIILQSH